MNIFDEIKNRWFRVFEQKTDSDKQLQVTSINPMCIAQDVETLQKRVTELEGNLSDALTSVSSHFGPLAVIKDGILYYRIQGMFVRTSSILVALEFVHELLSTDTSATKKFRLKASEEMESEIFSIFKKPPL